MQKHFIELQSEGTPAAESGLAVAKHERPVPTVKATRVATSNGGALLVLTCPFSGETHRHGTTGPNFGNGDGPRHSHCVEIPSRTYVLRKVKSRSIADREAKR